MQYMNLLIKKELITNRNYIPKLNKIIIYTMKIICK